MISLSCLGTLMSSHCCRVVIMSSTTRVATLSTSAWMSKRMGKRVRSIPDWKRDKMEDGPWWKKPHIVMTSPLSRTEHPVSRFSDLESEVVERVATMSSSDLPEEDMEDPYCPAPDTCILCPRRYAPGHAPIPDYKNPKLLSQFVSPHTGRLYEKHITGLCSHMQDVVEKQVLRSHAAGLMSTRVKSQHYLQDPSLFNSNKPVRPNPF